MKQSLTSGAAADGIDESRGPRVPRHARGQRRVDAILDAASALLTEGGLTALTVDAVARRSGTSKSSMYHFFPDLDSVVSALSDRHVTAIQQRNDEQFLNETIDWAAMTAEETVDHYLEPFRSYLSRHPDVLLLMQTFRCAAREVSLDDVQIQRAERIVAARMPTVKPAERRARATTMLALTLGVIQMSSRVTAPLRVAMMRELRGALAAYITMLEASDSRSGDRAPRSTGRPRSSTSTAHRTARPRAAGVSQPG